MTDFAESSLPDALRFAENTARSILGRFGGYHRRLNHATEASDGRRDAPPCRAASRPDRPANR